MSQAQKRRIGFLFAPIVTITAGMIAFMYYSGVEAAPPNAGPSLGDEAPSLQVLRLRPPPPVVPPPVVPPPEYLLPLMIGPVPGLTTAWYEAPTIVPVPLGTTLEFKLTDLLPTMLVTWSGAVEVERGDTFSRAEYVPGTVGFHTVQAVVNPGFATESVLSSLLNVIDAPNITCTVDVSVPPLLVDANSTYYFGGTPIPEVARLRQDGPNHYHTSINQWITFTAQTQPTGFESMVEWRSGGAVLGLGQTLADQIITSTGSTIIEVGPVAVPEQVRIDTYSVTITSHVSNVDFITEGVPTTFTAVTDPPGYEADITWIASTLYGTVAPVVGSGPTFTAQFDDTVGSDLFQWLGTRADNARFVQDVLGACCIPASVGPCGTTPASCVENVTSPACSALGGTFLGPKTTCEQEVVEIIYTDGHIIHRIVTEQNCPDVSRAGGPCVDCGADKIDSWVSASDASGGSSVDFANFPIPAGFFGTGSASFDGTVSVLGVPIGDIVIPGCPPGPLNFGDADTLVRRSGGPFGDGDPFDRCDIPPVFPTGPVTVDIELVALRLESCEPIMVLSNGVLEAWNMRVGLSDLVPQAPGTLTATKTHCNGGTFDSLLNVCPKFTFTKVDPPNTVLVLDLCDVFGPGNLTIAATGADWVHDPAPNIDLPNPVCTTFHPGVTEVNTTTDCDCNGNSIRDKCDIENGTSQDCNANGIPDECDIAAGTSQDCNTNGIPDECDVPPSAGCPTALCLSGCSADCNENCIPDECEIDCNANGVPDDCDITTGTSQDCNSNGVPDECDIAAGTSQDCNANGIPDECDIAAGTSQDCNSNSVPDECEPDSDLDSVIDDCDNCPSVSNPGQEDLDGDGIGDACDSDDDNDGVLDVEDSDPTNPNVCRDLDADGCDDCTNTGADGSGGDPANDGPDNDGDGICDATDPDDDNDGVPDASDNCPNVSNPGQEDLDGDGIGDACDTCPGVALFESDFLGTSHEVYNDQSTRTLVEGWIGRSRGDDGGSAPFSDIENSVLSYKGGVGNFSNSLHVTHDLSGIPNKFLMHVLFRRDEPNEDVPASTNTRNSFGALVATTGVIPPESGRGYFAGRGTEQLAGGSTIGVAEAITAPFPLTTGTWYHMEVIDTLASAPVLVDLIGENHTGPQRSVDLIFMCAAPDTPNLFEMRIWEDGATRPADPLVFISTP